MTGNRITIAVFALIAAAAAGVLGYFLAPQSHRYQASAHVALLPAPNLTTEQASAFWEVLTRGQVSRTAAVLYNDPRWLPSAANAAKAAQGDLYLIAAALPETTMVTITMDASSPEAAELALNDVLTTATPEVTSLVVPYNVKVLWPPKGNAVPLPSPGPSQVAAAGALGGLLIGGGLGWFVVRLRRRRLDAATHAAATMDQEALPG
ncbi:MAG: hypothetical protein WCP30_07280 [Mycobacteriaceae bacterium]